MPLLFHPEPGSIVICDFSTGFRPPEMVKIRPVVIVSRRRRHGSGLVTVVPLSSTAPDPIEGWHYCLPSGIYPPARSQMWAKCDMVATVALDRLDRVKVRDHEGKRSYQIFQVGAEQLASIRAGIKVALDLI
jgi:mRNA interferase MazF